MLLHWGTGVFLCVACIYYSYNTYRTHINGLSICYDVAALGLSYLLLVYVMVRTHNSTRINGLSALVAF